MCRLKVRVTANAHRPGLTKLEGDVLYLKVSSPPVDGRANQELCQLLADVLRVAASLVAVRWGHMARLKTVEVQNIDEGQALAILRQHFQARAGIV